MYIHANCPTCKKEVGRNYYSNTETMGIKCWTCDTHLTYEYTQQEQAMHKARHDAHEEHLKLHYEYLDRVKKPISFVARVKIRFETLWHRIKW